MTSQYIIGGVTFPSALVKTLPAIPGLLSLGFFGTAGDGVNGNRISGGPALTTLLNAPAISANYLSTGRFGTAASGGMVVTLSGTTVASIAPPSVGGTLYVAAPIVTFVGGGGTGATAHALISAGAVTGFVVDTPGTGYTSVPTITLSGGNNSGLSTGIVRSGILSAGWTWAAVAKTPDVTGNISNIFNDQTNPVGPFGNIADLSFQGNTNLLRSSVGNVASITLPSSANQWRFVAMSYSGGAAGTTTVYSLSDNLSNTTAATANTSSTGGQTAQLGPSPYASTNVTAGEVDTAAYLIASGPLNLATLQSIYASMKSIMARRGLTVL